MLMTQDARMTVSRRTAITGLIGLGSAFVASPSSLAEADATAPVPAAGVAAERPPDKKPGKAWLTLPPTPALPQVSRQDTVRASDARIFVAQFGKGPSVLMLHGGLANSNYWGHQVAHLQAKHTVIVMDTRGHGRSPFVPGPASYRLFAADAIAVLDQLGISKCAVAGWSDGGITGLLLAIDKPERVSGLFAFGANTSLSGLQKARGNLFATYKSRCKDEYAQLSPEPGQWPKLLGQLGAMWRSEPNIPNKDLARIQVPVTIADGAYDEIIRREHTEAMAKAIPGAKLEILPNVSHFGMLQDPAAFNAALDRFLAVS
jgi:pimeloyl-ACP methyl ester carboxylesterase